MSGPKNVAYNNAATYINIIAITIFPVSIVHLAYRMRTRIMHTIKKNIPSSLSFAAMIIFSCSLRTSYRKTGMICFLCSILRWTPCIRFSFLSLLWLSAISSLFASVLQLLFSMSNALLHCHV